MKTEYYDHYHLTSCMIVTITITLTNVMSTCNSFDTNGIVLIFFNNNKVFVTWIAWQHSRWKPHAKITFWFEKRTLFKLRRKTINGKMISVMYSRRVNSRLRLISWPAFFIYQFTLFVLYLFEISAPSRKMLTDAIHRLY